MSKYIIKEPTPQYGANTARIVNVPDEVVKQKSICQEVQGTVKGGGRECTEEIKFQRK